MKISIVDDYQANKVPVKTEHQKVQNNVRLVLADEYLADSLDPDLLFVKYDPSQYDNLIFVINIEDDYTKANDEYVLITEDGFIISLEDYYNQDEIAIIVR